MSRPKRRFREYPPAKRAWVSILFAVSVALVIAAERDLQLRSADEVRGSKLLWRLLCLNAVGAAGYF